MSLDKKPSLEQNNNPTSNIEVGLDWLEQKFTEKYGLSVETFWKLKEFKFEKQATQLQNETLWELQSLRWNLNNLEISQQDKETLWNFSNEKFQSLIWEIQSQQINSQEKLSKLQQNILWENIHEIASSKHKNDTFFSNKRLAQVCNPTKPHHHFDGVIVGASKSCIALAKTVGTIFIDTIKTPVDLYKIATNKAYTDQFNNI